MRIWKFVNIFIYLHQQNLKPKTSYNMDKQAHRTPYEAPEVELVVVAVENSFLSQIDPGGGDNWGELSRHRGYFDDEYEME